MTFSINFNHSERKRTTTSAATDDFEREYQKFIEEQKKIKQEHDAAKSTEAQNVQVSEETVAAVDAIIEATDTAEQEQTEKISKKKKKKSAEDTAEL